MTDYRLPRIKVGDDIYFTQDDNNYYGRVVKVEKGNVYATFGSDEIFDCTDDLKSGKIFHTIGEVYSSTINKAIEILDADKPSAKKDATPLLKSIYQLMPSRLRDMFDAFTLGEITLGEMLDALEARMD